MLFYKKRVDYYSKFIYSNNTNTDFKFFNNRLSSYFYFFKKFVNRKNLYFRFRHKNYKKLYLKKNYLFMKMNYRVILKMVSSFYEKKNKYWKIFKFKKKKNRFKKKKKKISKKRLKFKMKSNKVAKRQRKFRNFFDIFVKNKYYFKKWKVCKEVKPVSLYKINNSKSEVTSNKSRLHTVRYTPSRSKKTKIINYLKFNLIYTYKKFYEKTNVGKVRIYNSAMHIDRIHPRQIVKSIFLKKTYNLVFKKNHTIGIDPISKASTMYRRNKEPYHIKFFFNKSLFRKLRIVRAEIDKQFHVNAVYQQQITKFLFRFKSLSLVGLFSLKTMNVFNILNMSNLFKNKLDLDSFFSKQMVHINGFTVRNTQAYLFRGDAVVVTLGWNVFIYLKYSTYNLYVLRKKHYSDFFRYIKKNRKTKKPIDYWWKRYKYLGFKTPSFLEVDFLTLSFIIIRDLRLKEMITNANSKPLPRNALFNLNWKFIT